MTPYAIAAWELPSLPIAGSGERFPVRHIFCVGRNYAEHAKEMGGDATREPPFFFTKAADSLFPVVPPEVGVVQYPLATRNLHHEVELVVAIGKRARRLVPDDALDVVFGYAVGIDLTRRDLQNEMREKKRPWDIGKSFAQAAPIGPLATARDVGHPTKGAIELDVNAAPRQRGDLSQMIWDVPHTLQFLSEYYELMPGDLVFTGTPSGVGAVVPDDRLDARIAGLAPLAIVIAPAAA